MRLSVQGKNSERKRQAAKRAEKGLSQSCLQSSTQREVISACSSSESVALPIAIPLECYNRAPAGTIKTLGERVHASHALSQGHFNCKYL